MEKNSTNQEVIDIWDHDWLTPLTHLITSIKLTGAGKLYSHAVRVFHYNMEKSVALHNDYITGISKIDQFK